MSQIGLTESVKGDARRFEIWLQGRAEVHTIQASTLDVKQSWVRQIKGVLMSQLAELKGKQNSALGKTNHKYVRSFAHENSRSGNNDCTLNELFADLCGRRFRGKLKAAFPGLCVLSRWTVAVSYRTLLMSRNRRKTMSLGARRTAIPTTKMRSVKILARLL